MRQWNDVELLIECYLSMLGSDNAGKLRFAKKLFDSQFSDRNNQLWMQQVEFFPHPLAAVFYFHIVGHAVSAGFGFSWETPANGGHIYVLPEGLFVNAYRIEPFKQGLASCPGKWAPHLAFARSWRLANQIYFAENRSVCDYRPNHKRAGCATFQFFNVS